VSRRGSAAGRAVAAAATAAVQEGVRSLAPLAAALLVSCGGGSSSPDGAGSCSFPPALSGPATSYAGTSAGACMFPAGLSLYAAVPPAVYGGARTCGACVEVTGPAGTATLAVVDLCPECEPAQLDLSPAAWDAVVGAAPGRAAITWREVACDEPGPLRFVLQAGANPWFAQVVVLDHRHPIAAVELLPAGPAAWLPLARDAANQWYRSSGPAPFATPLRLRATDVFGHATATAAPLAALAPSAEATAPQLEACPP
jgi:expansin (peptidoglycan-binding protein)